MFSAATLAPQFTGLRFGQPLYVYASLGSTNDEARRLAEDGAPEGALVVAEAQTAGRGRAGRTWLTPAGQALAFSLVLRPALSAEHATQLTMLAGLAVCEAIEQLTPLRLALKWPNDVLSAGKKVGGILLETALAGERVDYAVVGVGLNVSFAPAPEAVDFPATSLQAETGQALDRAQLLKTILRQMEQRYPQLGTPELHTAWRARLWLMGEPVLVRAADGDYTGQLEDVAANGALILRLENGATAQFLAADVRLRKSAPFDAEDVSH